MRRRLGAERLRLDDGVAENIATARRARGNLAGVAEGDAHVFDFARDTPSDFFGHAEAVAHLLNARVHALIELAQERVIGVEIAVDQDAIA